MSGKKLTLWIIIAILVFYGFTVMIETTSPKSTDVGDVKCQPYLADDTFVVVSTVPIIDSLRMVKFGRPNSGKVPRVLFGLSTCELLAGDTVTVSHFTYTAPNGTRQTMLYVQKRT